MNDAAFRMADPSELAALRNGGSEPLNFDYPWYHSKKLQNLVKTCSQRASTST